ncbi:MAG: hypothetical protein AB1724_07855, partial [Thermodesulfobacteriota bacterium]
LQSPYGLLPLPRLRSNNEPKETLTESELSYPKKLSDAPGPPQSPEWLAGGIKEKADAISKRYK